MPKKPSKVTKKAKVSKVTHIVVWDDWGDEVRTYTSYANMKKNILEMFADGEANTEDIKIYEVKSVGTVEVSITF